MTTSDADQHEAAANAFEAELLLPSATTNSPPSCGNGGSRSTHWAAP